VINCYTGSTDVKYPIYTQVASYCIHHRYNGIRRKYLTSKEKEENPGVKLVLFFPESFARSEFDFMIRQFVCKYATKAFDMPDPSPSAAGSLNKAAFLARQRFFFPHYWSPFSILYHNRESFRVFFLHGGKTERTVGLQATLV
jgi:hypothetical protein